MNEPANPNIGSGEDEDKHHRRKLRPDGIGGPDPKRTRDGMGGPDPQPEPDGMGGPDTGREEPASEKSS